VAGEQQTPRECVLCAAILQGLLFCLRQLAPKPLDFVGTLLGKNLPTTSASFQGGNVVAQPLHIVLGLATFPLPTISASLEEPKQLGWWRTKFLLFVVQGNHGSLHIRPCPTSGMKKRQIMEQNYP
jgi:hypothetical protein